MTTRWTDRWNQLVMGVVYLVISLIFLKIYFTEMFRSISSLFTWLSH